ncbi:Peptidoglycan-binding lysin domain protein [Solidesulfovibrio fructosivorans JJ]]|uniref:Peptidoglycan-binding lysin domain protein n=1 Tax=Solidesulfovibrio fructosivorans JJ] TaxID=596151 RepID=E1JS75_SOLFR|nr:DUF459 domain-containing protein [Solidesulfovibrio fructosivorans]EFL52844.1 Peptidoglycan-binding lysin domain protein [Solidesulfovibrio fructosivorans JJ]]
MRNPSQALLLAVLMASLILPPVLPAAKAAAAGPAHNTRTRILLVGDSLSIGLGKQLETVFAGQPGVRFEHLGKVSSGLANPAFFDWDAHLTSLVAASHPDIVLVMVGANDDKPLPGANGKSLPFGTKAWDAAYAARLSKLHAIVRAANPGASVYFIGVPVMADAAFDKKMIHMSGVIAATARRLPDSHYIDVRDVLAAADGAFAPMARTPDGGLTKLRADDGVHISGTGSRLLAGRCLEAVADPAGLPRARLLASIEDRNARPVAGAAAKPAVVPVTMVAAVTPEPAKPRTAKPQAAKPAVAKAQARPAKTPEVAVAAAKPASPATAAAYTVADGDTLWSVAKRLGVSADALTQANPGVDPRRMSIGQSLSVPAGGAMVAAAASATQSALAAGHGHIVAEGDNYWSVARRYDVSVAALTAANPGVDPTRLRIGQELVIPGAASGAPVHVADDGRYVVADGDNFWSIAHRLGIDVAALTQANAAVNPQKLQPGQVLSLPGVSKADSGDHAPALESRTVGDAALYPVAKGDTLWGLSRRFGVDLDTLLTVNGEVDPSRLQVGQLVTIPGGQPVASAETLAFPVSEGDTLASIAKRFDVSVAELMAANPGVDPLRLQVGQVLRVPSSLAAVAASGSGRQTPAQASVPVANPAEATPAPGRSPRQHTVSLGDTVWDIAQRYGLSVERILAANSGLDPMHLRIGQTMRLPGDAVVTMAAVR